MERIMKTKSVHYKRKYIIRLIAERFDITINQVMYGTKQNIIPFAVMIFLQKELLGKYITEGYMRKTLIMSPRAFDIIFNMTYKFLSKEEKFTNTVKQIRRQYNSEFEKEVYIKEIFEEIKNEAA